MKKKLLIIFFAVAILFSGCVYYNTLFNAKKDFVAAEKIRKNNKSDNKRTPSGALTLYSKVIKRCGYILTEYKDSKYADEALFLLSKSLFYKGTVYTQAIEKFQDLIKYYPNSKYVPESKIYIARSMYEMNDKESAYKYMQDVLSKKDYKKYHSKALMILAKYYADDKSYDQALKYLNDITENYKDSEEYSKAYVMQGKMYLEQENYEKSLEIFRKVVKIKKFEKRTKLDAKYYIALNLYNLNETKKALKAISKLMLTETNTSQIPKLRVLNARILIKNGDYDKAISILNAVIKDNRRTKISAEATYYLGELYFYNLKDYEKAIKAYNEVKKQSNKSEFIEDATIKSSIASQIIQYHNPSRNTDSYTLIMQQLKLGEYYLQKLNMPDSTFKIYQSIFTFKDTLNSKLDSLKANLQKETAKLDSTDSLNFIKNERKVKNLNKKVENMNKLIALYNDEIIPKIRFNQMWIYKTVYKDSTKADSIYHILKTDFKDTKYRYAADDFMQGKPVKFITPQHEKDWQTYNAAVAEMDSLPQDALGKLYKSAESTDEKLANKSKFTLGYINYFILKDSTRAKTYFNELLDNADYKNFIYKFYDGENFTVIDSFYVPDTLIKPDEEETEDKKK